MSIAENLKHIQQQLPECVTLVAVSKTKPITDLQEAYHAGQRVFGENKIQEMTQKWEALPKDIQWHMIGHVQRNKVKYMAEYVSLIHGVDSLRLLKEINKQAKKHQRVISCLLQVHIAEESTKFGFSSAEIEEVLSAEEFTSLEHIKIVGLMGMATFTSDEEKISREFNSLQILFNDLKTKYKQRSNFDLQQLSMGMSADFPLAIAHGSTMVRVGSSIFGKRNYN
ncbi:MAG: YggS family pyridoxal phosphate-dependent enzyme [Flavobacteriaceae bacterium]|nr:YggS family pyridoxal phosphate-dependent enzyme [Flavobacteriaceae bacterium]